jgi:hypothetical protein
MPTYRIETPEHTYSAIVERGVIRSAAQYLPAKIGARAGARGDSARKTVSAGRGRAETAGADRAAG